MCSHFLRASCDFFYGASGATRGKSVQRLCGDCTEIVQCQCSCCAVSASSARKSCGDRTLHGARAGIVQCHLRHVYFSLSQIVEAAEPVNPYENLTAASCLAEAAQKGGYGLRRPIANQMWTRHEGLWALHSWLCLHAHITFCAPPPPPMKIWTPPLRCNISLLTSCAGSCWCDSRCLSASCRRRPVRDGSSSREVGEPCLPSLALAGGTFPIEWPLDDLGSKVKVKVKKVNNDRLILVDIHQIL